MGLPCKPQAGLWLIAAIARGQAIAQRAASAPLRPPKPWQVEPWVSLALTRHIGSAVAASLSPSLEVFEPVPEEIIVTAPRHIQDNAPLTTAIDASNPRTLEAAQPAVRNLQTFCEDKGPPATICFDMTQVPVRTRLATLIFGE